MANDVILTPSEEEQRIVRSLMAWVNGYSNLPVSVVNYEQLKADASMALSLTAGAYITRRFIAGGHVAEVPFSLIYRIKPATSNDKRLKADEALNAIGDWAMSNPPTLGDGLVVRKLEVTARSMLLVPYEDGSEDHQILMKLTYEVL